MQTPVADNTGKQARFDEEFLLRNVHAAIRNQDLLLFELHEEDAPTTEVLAKASPMSFVSLT